MLFYFGEVSFLMPLFLKWIAIRELKLRVERRRGESGEIFDCVEGLMFKDGFLYKTVSMKSISANNIQPTFDELEKFRKPGEDTSGDLASLSTLFANRKKGHFLKGDAVIVVRGDLKNLEGWVEKVEEGTVHIKPKMPGLPVIVLSLLLSLPVTFGFDLCSFNVSLWIQEPSDPTCHPEMFISVVYCFRQRQTILLRITNFDTI